MKKTFTLVLFLLAFSVFSQNEIAEKVYERLSENVVFKPFTVLTVNKPSNIPPTAVVSNASFAKINAASVTSIVTNNPENIEIEIPYQGKMIVLQLYRVNLFADNFHIDSDKSKNLSYQNGVYYRGIVKGDRKSIASFNFFNNELNGIISNHDFNNLNVGKVNQKDNNSDYIVYSDNYLKLPYSMECHTKDVVDKSIQRNQKSNNMNKADTKCVTVYFEIDYDLFLANGSNTNTTANWITSIFNNVQTIYANDGIKVAIKSLYIWTEKDPYQGKESTDYLYQFGDVRPVFDGDVGQLLGIDPGNLGGVAYQINGLCSRNNFSYSDVNFEYSNLPLFSWDVYVITHELGHLLGSPHTHACVWNGNNTAIDNCGPTFSNTVTEGVQCLTTPPTIPTEEEKGTIMSYCHLKSSIGVNLSNGFGPQPAAAIRDAIKYQYCLSTDCVNTCINTVYNIQVAEITNTSALITWDDDNIASKWEISVTPYNTVKDWKVVAKNSYPLQNLLPNTFYSIDIRPNCEFGLTAPIIKGVFATNTDFCNGVTITDSGGLNYNYLSSESYVRTIIPNLSNAKIKLSFSAFDLEKDFDYLYLYDGNSTQAPDLSNGGFTGTTIPGNFVSTAVDGSLTLEFFSDGYVVGAGYVAQVSCESNLANTTFSPNIDFTYYPNPSSGIVTIASKTKINEVEIYNLEGRLLYKNKINGLETKVDMTLFSKGTYFFKLKFNEKDVNFKILKM